MAAKITALTAGIEIHILDAIKVHGVAIVSKESLPVNVAGATAANVTAIDCILLCIDIEIHLLIVEALLISLQLPLTWSPMPI